MALDPADLEHVKLKPRLKEYLKNGLPDSAAFLSWFLENYYRLDETAARDAICDRPNDKGVDGIFVDENAEEIEVFQVKFREKDRAKGEGDLKNLVATLTQFRSGKSVESLQRGGASEDLKRLLRDLKIAERIDAGFDVKGVFVTNTGLDKNAQDFLDHHPNIAVFDKSRLAAEFVDVAQPQGVKGTFSFTAADGYIDYAAGSSVRMYLFPALASELVQLKGIADQSLFALNVRLSLGNTKVNKEIQVSLRNRKSHKRFPLFHNGITLLAQKVTGGDAEVNVRNYVVVNGAQSLTALWNNRAQITKDLQILLRIVQVGADANLANLITRISNNQNAIKPRDLKSNHKMQTRLKSEFEAGYADKYYYVIKQGEERQNGIRIENDEAGRLLLSFDLRAPWNAHQIYRVFETDYSRIFGRPEVSPSRIIFLWRLSELVAQALNQMVDRRVASYRLTRYFLLYSLREILSESRFGKQLIRNPEAYIDHKRWPEISKFLESVLVGLVTDFEDEIAPDEVDEDDDSDDADDFDYKAELKSPNRVPVLARTLVKSYLRDLRRKKIDDPDKTFGTLAVR
jgi:hypothetical protein